MCVRQVDDRKKLLLLKVKEPAGQDFHLKSNCSGEVVGVFTSFQKLQRFFKKMLTSLGEAEDFKSIL